jgi:hypothetical protein
LGLQRSGIFLQTRLDEANRVEISAQKEICAQRVLIEGAHPLGTSRERFELTTHSRAPSLEWVDTPAACALLGMVNVSI